MYGGGRESTGIEPTAGREAKGYRRLSAKWRAKVEEARRSNPKATQEEVVRAAGVSPHGEPDRARGPAWRRPSSHAASLGFFIGFTVVASASSGRAAVLAAAGAV